MGSHYGFDTVPRLSKGAADRQNWESFIEAIKKHYQDDDLVETKSNYIEFKAGEHPRLPFEGHKFLRFSSKVVDGQADGAKEYVDTVAQVAKTQFDFRIRCWNEAVDERGFYSWPDVNDSIKSYEKPDEPEMPANTARLDPVKELDLPLFEVLSIAGKGKGVVARCDIPRGTRIHHEKPLFATPNMSPLSVMESTIATKLKSLPKAEQRLFLSLHNNFPGQYPFSSIVKTNALPLGPGSLIGAIFPTICRTNHSCLPNANHSWNEDTGCESIYAVRHIKAGEEITISYDSGLPSDARQAHFKSAFGFHCNCSLCSLPLSELQISDARRRKIKLLDDAISEPDRVMNRPGDCIADCHSLLLLLEEEYDGSCYALIARLNYDAFQISITHGDQARASIFAERAYKSRIICEGEQSPDTRKMKDFAKNPADHRNFGSTTKWKTAKNLVPKGLEADGFEEWLWRRGKR